MATSETEAGVDVVSKRPKEAELRYRIGVDDSGTKATLASIRAVRASDAVDGGSLVFSTDAVGGEVTPHMVIDANGGVGIGLTGPKARLHVDGDAMFTGPLTIEGALNGQSLNVSGQAAIAGTLKVGGDLVVAGKLEASGFAGDGGGLRNVVPRNGSVGSAHLANDPNSLKKVSGGLMATGEGTAVGIGTERPKRELHICDDDHAEIIIEQTQAKTDFKRWNFVADGGNAQTPSKFYIRQLNDAGTGGNVALMIDGEGRLWSSSGTLIGSDARLKTDISSLGRMGEKLMTLRGVRFKWRDAKAEEAYRIGLIAQEVEEVIPEVVETGPDGMKGINYPGLVAAIIGVLQDQEVELRKLRAEVDRAQSS